MIDKIFLRFSLLIVILICSLELRSAHIVGGEMTYSCVASDINARTTTFRVVMTVYRDKNSPNGAPFDTDASIGVFLGSGSTWILHTQTKLDHAPASIVPWENECIDLPPNISVEKATYQFNVTLPWSDQNYLIAYQRCCRNGTITNILDPGGAGAVFSVEITPEAQQSCNDSPVFNKFPPVVICVNTPLKFDHSASDVQGDQIQYEFCAPQSSGGKEEDLAKASTCEGVKPSPDMCRPPFGTVIFKTPTFSDVNPVGGNPQVTINSETGLITGVPTVIGQYVVGVCAKEYRNGKLLSVIRRDFQFNVTTCQAAVFADFEPDNSNYTNAYVEKVRVGNTINLRACGTKDIYLTNTSVQENKIKAYKWDFTVNPSNIQTPSKNFEASFPNYGSYKGKMYLNPSLLDCTDSIAINLEIYDRPNADFSFAYDTCIAEPVVFTNKSKPGVTSPININQWNFDNEDTINQTNPSYFFETPGVKRVVLDLVDAAGCKDTVSKDISYFPVPGLIVLQPSQFIGCQPASIFFNNLSHPVDSTYQVIWDFGDGNTIDKISPTHVYENLGLYDVHIKIVSPIGCETERNYQDLIEVLEKPKADFSYTPENTSIFNNEVIFTDQSQGASSWFWTFGDLGLAYEPNPVFTFLDTGVYDVKLVVSHVSGCTDTASAIIDVKPFTQLFMPNAFTPNNDGKNDLFLGKGLTDGILDYEMTIWNRWGEKIFKTNDPLDGWNGELNNNGQLSPQGVYVYSVIYFTPRGEKKSLKGHVTLIR